MENRTLGVKITIWSRGLKKFTIFDLNFSYIFHFGPGEKIFALLPRCLSLLGDFSKSKRIVYKKNWKKEMIFSQFFDGK